MEVISLDLIQILSSIFWFGFILVSCSSVVYSRFDCERDGFLKKYFNYVLFSIIITSSWFFGTSNYLIQHGFKENFSYIVLMGIVLVYLVNSTGIFLDNGFSFINKKQLIYTVLAILAAFYLSGWLSANIKSTLYRGDGNKVLLASYGDNYVWGKCIKESASYFVTKQDENIKLKKIKGRDVDELKICFRRANK
ncbi:hypothetical protein SRDD_27110 [Serratia sp. DD3]|nr:hypothetical protein SRDD_27110 [Serratia sp. DD3]